MSHSRARRSSPEWKAVEAAILQLDPVGIADMPEAEGEYDELIRLVVIGLDAGRPAADVAAAYARELQRWGMGYREADVAHFAAVFAEAWSRAARA